MRRTIATLGVVGLGIMAATVSANAAPPEEKKITICHATNAAGNPFVVETINLSALKAHADDTRDIVPANDGDIFPDGQNLTARQPRAAGQRLRGRRCPSGGPGPGG